MRYLLLLAFFPVAFGFNYLIISPVFGYSHMKFMGRIADILADAGHNVVRFTYLNIKFLISSILDFIPTNNL